MKVLRILIEIFCPALLGTILFFGIRAGDFTSGGGVTARLFLGYLVWAYAFALIPSLVYAASMEFLLRKMPSGFLGWILVVGASTFLGTVAGICIRLASEADVVAIGALVGLALGLVLPLFTDRRPGQGLVPSRTESPGT